MQHDKYVDHQDAKIYCATNQFPGFKVLGPHNKLNGARGLGKHYHMRFDTKLGYGTCAISCIPRDCPTCTSILDKPWSPGVPAQQKTSYQPVKYFTYSPVLCSFNI